MNETQAFLILGQSRAASPEEIHSAYLDLVKVWHPDRFANDPSLQRKAQEKLKEINEAYRTLISSSAGKRDRKNSETGPNTSPKAAADAHMSASDARKLNKAEEPRSRLSAVPPWAVGFIILMGLVSSFDYSNRNGAGYAGRKSELSPSPTFDTDRAPAAKAAHTAPKIHTQNRVLLSTPTSQLNAEDRESLESACLLAKNLEGPAAYYRCAHRELIKLATAPSRPDLSSLSDSERQSIESACIIARSVEGPAAYRLCLLKQIQILATQKASYSRGGLR